MLHLTTSEKKILLILLASVAGIKTQSANMMLTANVARINVFNFQTACKYTVGKERLAIRAIISDVKYEFMLSLNISTRKLLAQVKQIFAKIVSVFTVLGLEFKSRMRKESFFIRSEVIQLL